LGNVGRNCTALLLSWNSNFLTIQNTHTMTPEIYNDFIPYWDDSTETEYDHQEPVRLKVFDPEDDGEDLPF
jgi:hypothetical protein